MRGFGIFMKTDKEREEINNFILLITRKERKIIKEFTKFTRRATPIVQNLLSRFILNKEIESNAQSFSQFRKGIRTRGLRTQFPKSNIRLRYTNLASKVILAEADGFT